MVKMKGRMEIRIKLVAESVEVVQAQHLHHSLSLFPEVVPPDEM